MVTMVDVSTIIAGGRDQNGVVTGTTKVFEHHTKTHRMLRGEQKFPLYPRIQLRKRCRRQIQDLFRAEAESPRSSTLVA